MYVCQAFCTRSLASSMLSHDVRCTVQGFGELERLVALSAADSDRVIAAVVGPPGAQRNPQQRLMQWVLRTPVPRTEVLVCRARGAA